MIARADARLTPARLLDGDRVGGQARLGLRSVAASRTTDEPLPPIETIGDVVEALRLLKVGVGVANYRQ